jgi:hypothetical protein
VASAPAVTVRSVARTRPAAAGALLALAAVVLFGAGLRLAWNDVSSFSRADEATYLLSAQALSSDWTSYPEIVRRYIETPTLWVYPLPSRWTGIVVTAAACTVAPCTFHTLAWVETLAGIAGIALTFVLARRLFGDVAAWLAAALTAVAPIQLAMGRRALEDEVFLVAMLGALALTVEIAHRQVPSARLLTAAVVVYALAFSLSLAISLIEYFVAEPKR